MNKRFQVWLPLLFALVMIWGMILGYKLQRNVGRNSLGSTGMNSASAEVLELIKEKYVDKENMDSLNIAAIDAILEKLDPHSVYIPPVRLTDVNNDLQGSMKGIGIEFQVFNDTMNIMYVVEKSPAAGADLRVGDQVLTINDSSIAGKHISADDMRQRLRGKGRVSLTILRNNKQLPVAMERGMIPIPSLDAAYMAAPGVGYIRLNKFATTTYQEFMDAATKLQQQGMQKLILDLRDNGGGVLEAAVNIADELLPDGDMIVYTEGDKVKRKDYKSTKPGIFEKGALVVIMNELSASASEVLAGALQDNDRCTIVGRRSFGKGLVQEQYQLSDGGALRLTIARYYTPLGRSIQKPYANGRKLYNEELFDRFHHTDSTYNDSAYTAGKMYTTPGGRKVYGGGGISPEVYVPFDTATLSMEATRLYTTNTLTSFTYRFFKQHQTALQSWKSTRDFEQGFNLPDAAWIELVAYARQDSIRLPENNAKLKTEVLERVKALLARQIWRSQGYYEVRNADDPAYRKALQTVQALRS